ncbi:hypothetical protein GCM10027605_63020 [Micromonospora zhanjiangensis]
MVAGPSSGRGRTSHRSSSTVETWAPSVRSPAAISSVSRARSGRDRVDGPAAIALSTRARAVIDFEPGSRTVDRTGPAAAGAIHGCGGFLAVRFTTGTFCRPAPTKGDRRRRPPA